MQELEKDFIKVICPICNTGYKISRLKLKKPASQSVCKKCGANLVFVKKEEETKEIPLTPAFQTGTKGEAKRALKRDRNIAIGIIGTGILLGLILVGVFFSVIKNNAAYKAAESFIKNNNEIKKTVGEPMKFGFLPVGSVKVSGQGGKAEFKIKVKGKTGATSVYIRLVKDQGKWQVIYARYVDKNGETRTIACQRIAYKKRKHTKPKLQGHLMSGYSLYKKKRYTEAISEFDKAIKESPDNPEVYYWRGRCYLYLKRYDNAIDDFKQTIELKPEHVEAYNNLGWIYGIKHEYKESVDYLSKSIELAPNNAWAYYTRARVYYEMGRIADAKSDLKRACELGSKSGCKVYKRLKKEKR